MTWTIKHTSDCAVHNAPAYPIGPCDCGAAKHNKEVREDDVVKHVNTMFGGHGGVGDPPADDAIRAIIRGTREYVVDALGQKIKPRV